MSWWSPEWCNAALSGSWMFETSRKTLPWQTLSVKVHFYGALVPPRTSDRISRHLKQKCLIVTGDSFQFSPQSESNVFFFNTTTKTSKVTQVLFLQLVWCLLLPRLNAPGFHLFYWLVNYLYWQMTFYSIKLLKYSVLCHVPLTR